MKSNKMEKMGKGQANNVDLRKVIATEELRSTD